MIKNKFDGSTERLAEDCIDGCLINPLFLFNRLVPRSSFVIRTEHQNSAHYLDTEADG